MDESNEEFEYASKYYFAKYLIVLLDRLVYFLVEQTDQFDSDLSLNISQSMKSTHNFYKLHEYKENLKQFKSHIFLLNNIEYIRKFLNGLNLSELFLQINKNFEYNMTRNMNVNIERACGIFRYLERKWKKTTQSKANEFKIFKNKSSPSKKPSDYRASLRRRSLSIFSENLDSYTNELNEEKIEHVEASNTEIIPFNQAKSKTKEAFIVILKEILLICTQTSIQDHHVNNTIKGIAHKILRPILESVFESGRKAEIVQFLDIIHATEEHIQMINVIFEKIFPLNSNVLV